MTKINFGTLNIKNTTTIPQNLCFKIAEKELINVFKEIAFKKNKLLEPQQNDSIKYTDAKAGVTLSARNLLHALQSLISALKAHENFINIQDLDNATTLLEKLITTDQENDHVLSQFLLVCSSIKIHLGKICSTI